MPVQTIIKHRGSTAAAWVSANPVLAAREMGLETDTNKIKFGDGTTAWNALDYAGGVGGGLTVSETAPADPEEGWMWFASAEAKTYVYYDSAWVEMSPAIEGPQGIQGEPGGDGITIQATAPTNTNILWLDSDDPANQTTLPMGGASGTVLTKSSSDDYDTEWAVLPAISPSILTTQGDLIVASGASTPARLGIGTNGQVLTSNGTTATWSALPSTGAPVLLSTTSLSGTGTNITGISQSYSTLKMEITGLYESGSSSATLTLQYDTGSGYNNFTASRVRSGTAAVNSELMNIADSSFAPDGGTFTAYFYKYSTSSVLKQFEYIALNSYGGNSAIGAGGLGTGGTARVINNIRITTWAGTTSLNGTVKLYGIA